MPQKTHKTHGELEAEICRAIVGFEKEYMGRGPREIKAFIVENIIYVRLNGTLTKAEKEMVKKEGGVDLIKKVRRTMLENSTTYLFDLLNKIVGIKVSHFHSDLSTRSGEEIIVFYHGKKDKEGKIN